MIVIMKRSIKRLPKRTQEELAVLQELILQYLVNVRMIILYGSYARGEYVIWDETYDERGGLTYYQSDLDILVICDTGDAIKAENHANAFVVPGMINEWKEGDILHHLRSLLKARQLLIGLSEGNIISFMRP